MAREVRRSGVVGLRRGAANPTYILIGPSLFKPDMVYTLDRGHGLHGGVRKRATHASPLPRRAVARRAGVPGSDGPSPIPTSRARSGHCGDVYLYCTFVSLSAVRLPCRNGPRRAGASRFWRRRRRHRKVGKVAPVAIERDTALLAGPGAAGADAALPNSSESRWVARAREAVCIFVSLFVVGLQCRNSAPRTGASCSWRRRRRPRNVGKAAPAAVERHAALLAGPGPVGADAAIPIPSVSLVRGARAQGARGASVRICIFIRREPCRNERRKTGRSRLLERWPGAATLARRRRWRASGGIRPMGITDKTGHLPIAGMWAEVADGAREVALVVRGDQHGAAFGGRVARGRRRWRDSRARSLPPSGRRCRGRG